MFREKMYRLFENAENSTIIHSVRSGLVNSIPVLLIGSFSLLLQTLPIPFYQDFIRTFGSGILLKIFQMIYNATFGMLSVYITFSVSTAYCTSRSQGAVGSFGAGFAALMNYCIFSGFLSDSFTISSLSVKGMFSGLFAAVISVELYILVLKLLPNKKIYADSSDTEFNGVLRTLVPTLLTILCGAVFNLFIMTMFHVSSFQELFIRGVHMVFDHLGKSLFTAILFVLLSNFLWFFGIHGTDVFDDVVLQFFSPGLEINQALAVPTEIFTKEFFDIFVFMGGCGTTFSLMIAILLFSTHKNNKRLARMSLLPMVFNINEMMVFGLPIVLNPVFLIPFLLTPFVCVLTTTAAMQLGLVPLTVHTVEWTTPILLGGYTATGSLAGSFMQLFNLAVGVLIYLPFVKLYDKQKFRQTESRLKDLIRMLQDSEEHNIPVTLTQQPGVLGTVAKALALDFTNALEREDLTLYYQPQFNKDDRCIGMEALLRWYHPVWGMIYPPLVVKLADETDSLIDLEHYVLRHAAKDLSRLPHQGDLKLSVNITSKTLQSSGFPVFLASLCGEYQVSAQQICLEVTEQIALRINYSMQQRLEDIRKMGFLMAIDDFSMGSTSLKYLQSEQFDIVKLDGKLIRDIKQVASNQNIIDSIVHLSKSLGFQVLAEYVETEEQRDILAQIGCELYQGYLYSPAIPFDELTEFLKKYS